MSFVRRLAPMASLARVGCLAVGLTVVALPILSVATPANATAGPTPTTTSIGYSANPVAYPDSVDITVSTVVTGLTDPPTGGSEVVQECIDGSSSNVPGTGFGDPSASCGGTTPTATWTNVDTGAPASIVDTFDTGTDATVNAASLPQTIGFRGHYVPSGGSGYHESASDGVDLVVNPTPCTGGVTIAADLANGLGDPPAGYSGSWQFTMKVHACQDENNVTAQGGANGWAPVTGSSADTGFVAVRKTTNKNTILLWTIGNMIAGQDATLTVTVTGTIKAGTPSGTVLGLSGAWSSTFTDPTTGLQAQSGYSGQVTIQVL